MAKYDWEQKYYYGNLIAVSNSFLAYAIRGELLLLGSRDFLSKNFPQPSYQVLLGSGSTEPGHLDSFLRP